MWCVHVVRACGACMWCVHVVRACGACMWCVHVVRACGACVQLSVRECERACMCDGACSIGVRLYVREYVRGGQEYLGDGRERLLAEWLGALLGHDVDERVQELIETSLLGVDGDQFSVQNEERLYK
jgi:hypothetical protein